VAYLAEGLFCCLINQYQFNRQGGDIIKRGGKPFQQFGFWFQRNNRSQNPCINACPVSACLHREDFLKLRFQILLERGSVNPAVVKDRIYFYLPALGQSKPLLSPRGGNRIVFPHAAVIRYERHERIIITGLAPGNLIIMLRFFPGRGTAGGIPERHRQQTTANHYPEFIYIFFHSAL
jgi:hypothetical protein